MARFLPGGGSIVPDRDAARHPFLRGCGCAEALVRKERIDGERYRIRFTPRRRGSHWSNINIRRVSVLKAAGRMKAAGLAAFAPRSRAVPPGYRQLVTWWVVSAKKAETRAQRLRRLIEACARNQRLV